MPNEELVCPACKSSNITIRTELPYQKKWYECYGCGLRSPWAETPEQALANFKAILINRVV